MDTDTDHCIFNFLQTSPVCCAEITLTDKSTREVIIRSLNIAGLTSIVFTGEELRTNTLYSGMLNATNFNGSALSTLDISMLTQTSLILVMIDSQLQVLMI